MPKRSSRPRRTRWLAILLILALGLGLAFVVFAVRLNALRDLRATGPNWSFPARVYSDGVTLAAGRSLPAEHLLAQLEARG